MTRARTVAVAALLALACGTRDGDATPRTSAAITSGAQRETPPAAERTSARRGDRHARAAARRPRKVKRVEGRVSRASERLVVIERHGRPELMLQVSPRTTVTLDGARIRPEALREGAEVRAAYRGGEEGRPTALSIDADTPRPAGAPPPAAREPAGASFTDQG